MTITLLSTVAAMLVAGFLMLIAGLGKRMALGPLSPMWLRWLRLSLCLAAWTATTRQVKRPHYPVLAAATAFADLLNAVAPADHRPASARMDRVGAGVHPTALPASGAGPLEVRIGVPGRHVLRVAKEMDTDMIALGWSGACGGERRSFAKRSSAQLCAGAARSGRGPGHRGDCHARSTRHACMTSATL
jgi:hypothetical protein